MKLYIWLMKGEELEIARMGDGSETYNPKENAKNLMEFLYSYVPGNTLEALSSKFLETMKDEWVRLGFTNESDEFDF